MIFFLRVSGIEGENEPVSVAVCLSNFDCDDPKTWGLKVGNRISNALNTLQKHIVFNAMKRYGK
jgi:hypothetical protein